MIMPTAITFAIAIDVEYSIMDPTTL
jgi:hypothetical protein